jgi:hypothetical protein
VTKKLEAKFEPTNNVPKRCTGVEAPAICTDISGRRPRGREADWGLRPRNGPPTLHHRPIFSVHRRAWTPWHAQPWTRNAAAQLWPRSPPRSAYTSVGSLAPSIAQRTRGFPLPLLFECLWRSIIAMSLSLQSPDTPPFWTWPHSRRIIAAGRRGSPRTAIVRMAVSSAAHPGSAK